MLTRPTTCRVRGGGAAGEGGSGEAKLGRLRRGRRQRQQQQQPQGRLPSDAGSRSRGSHNSRTTAARRAAARRTKTRLSIHGGIPAQHAAQVGGLVGGHGDRARGEGACGRVDHLPIPVVQPVEDLHTRGEKWERAESTALLSTPGGPSRVCSAAAGSAGSGHTWTHRRLRFRLLHGHNGGGQKRVVWAQPHCLQKGNRLGAAVGAAVWRRLEACRRGVSANTGRSPSPAAACPSPHPFA